MVIAFRRDLAVAVLAGACVLCGSALGQQSAKAQAGDAPAPLAEDEVIVRGRLGDLRRQLNVAEEAVYSRFNDINGDDRLDIHCIWQPKVGSRILERACQSNAWREQDANFAQATLRELRGEYADNPSQFIAEQLYMQQRVRDAMRRLAAEDPQLRDAIQRLGKAQEAVGEYRPTESLAREVTPGDEGLPSGAQEMLEVHIGRAPWTHPLTQRTFTIAGVSGAIRKLTLDCDQGSRKIQYQADVDWTLPAAWSGCALRVDAKRETTFALYEFR